MIITIPITRSDCATGADSSGSGSVDRRKNRVGPAAIQWQNAPMNDYDRIARVIRYLDAHQADQPNLATLAHHARLSPGHFHRLFSAWAGVTPKDFLQSLTLANAKARLRVGNSVLEAAMSSGLSGPGRLHDLCVTLEAASPGELKAGGAGWTIAAGIAESPFGRCVIGEGPRGVCYLSFIESAAGMMEIAALRAGWPRAAIRRDDAGAARLAGRIFAPSGYGTGSGLRAYVRGSAFQVRVWRALLQVEAGRLVSYGGLAAALDMPGAARAVGGAVGRNPLAYLIPCHRVIRETGVIGDYRWGSARKRAMLARELAGAAS
jgi:AraC family transcriptional regulator, regulatory protein of adaptative response / methylated-DNA-[protein]-cysteine methyltransferase